MGLKGPKDSSWSSLTIGTTDAATKSTKAANTIGRWVGDSWASRDSPEDSSSSTATGKPSMAMRYRMVSEMVVSVGQGGGSIHVSHHGGGDIVTLVTTDRHGMTHDEGRVGADVQ